MQVGTLLTLDFSLKTGRQQSPRNDTPFEDGLVKLSAVV